MYWVVTHKNGNVRAIVNADNADNAYVAFRKARIEMGTRPIKANHTVEALALPVNEGDVLFLKNTKPE